VAVYTLMRPRLGASTTLRWQRRTHVVAAIILGASLGLYDGLLGPGTGTFLVLGLIGVVGYAFVPATPLVKVVNFSTNLGALLFFVPAGAAVWSAGIVLGVGNMVGGYLGARMAIAKGATFIRVVFLVVVFALILRLSWDVLSA